jgi:hypothetical protein
MSTVHHWDAESNSSKGNPRLDMADGSTMLKVLLPIRLCYSSSL